MEELKIEFNVYYSLLKERKRYLFLIFFFNLLPLLIFISSIVDLSQKEQNVPNEASLKKNVEGYEKTETVRENIILSNFNGLPYANGNIIFAMID
jgi:hypothetical protein